MNPRAFVAPGKIGSGKPASAELIDAIRRCAAKRMSLGATADELTTRLHPLTRSAVAGIANRNGIKFEGKRGGVRKPRKPKDRRTIPANLPTVPEKRPIPPNLVTMRPAAHVRPPRAGCSWAGCGAHAEEGDMFCYSHGRKGLMG